MMRRALLVGIDHYLGSPLTGCVADAEGMAAMLEQNQDASPNYDVKLVTSDPGPTKTVTRGGLRTLLADLFNNAHDMEVLFFFAGHGTQTPWGGELVTQDYAPNSMGVSMNDVLTLANDSPAREVILILDCCFSGDLGNVPGLQSAAVAPAFRLDKTILGENVTVLAASRSTQLSAEVPDGGQGAFTRLLIDGLDGAAADYLGDVTSLSLYAFASRPFTAWQQRPVFKSHVSQPTAIRVCRPPLDPDLLRKLPRYFQNAEAHYTMTPAHEGVRPIPPGVAPTPDQEAFDYFKHLRNASLLTTDNSKDLYFVALDSEDVYLTRLGRYFWQLAKTHRL